jgi:hypothetical protein
MSYTNNTTLFTDTGSVRPFPVVSTTLSWDQIPSVSGIPVQQVKFELPPRYPSIFTFIVDSNWEYVHKTIEDVLSARGITYTLPRNYATFTVSKGGDPTDLDSAYVIHCCRKDENPQFVIEITKSTELGKNCSDCIRDLFNALKVQFGTRVISLDEDAPFVHHAIGGGADGAGVGDPFADPFFFDSLIEK